MERKTMRFYLTVQLILATTMLSLVNNVQALPALHIDSLFVEQNGNVNIVTVPVSLRGGLEPYGGINGHIIFPDGVVVQAVTPVGLIANGFIFDYRLVKEISGTSLYFIAYSATSNITASIGDILNVQLQVDSTLVPGSYPIFFAVDNQNALVNSRYALANAGGTVSVVLASPLTGNLTVRGVAGDFNNDMVVDLTDLLIVLQVVVRQNVSQLSIAGDVDGDGKVGVTDLNYILNTAAGL